MPFIEKNVVFGLVAYKRGKVFTDDAMPIGSILFVKLLFDMFAH
jgi:hypothetical protein